MRTLKLISDLEYNKRFKEVDGVKDYNNYRVSVENLDRILYSAEELVEVDETKNVLIEETVKGYNELFLQRGNPATKEQLEFARTTATILLGQLIETNTIPVIPAPCGFGKSTITQVFMKVICKGIKKGIWEDGMIIVTDKLEQLKELHNNLIEDPEVGYYYENEVNGKKYKTPYTYVMEGWTENSYEQGVCLNKKVKAYSVGMCCSGKCPFYEDCKISKQGNDQQYSPILLMTNARLKTFRESISQYGYYLNENKDEKVRNLIINDERPEMVETVNVSIKHLNDIQNEINILSVSTEDDIKAKQLLMNKWEYIRSKVVKKINDFASQYDRRLVANLTNESILLNDKEFISLWEKFMDKKHSFELKHIHAVLTRGGLFCRTKKNGDFIATIGMKNMLKENFKTVIFDATALVDPQYANGSGCAYENIIKFVDIESVRKFDNVTFRFYQKHKLNKTQFNNKNYLVDACVAFLESLPKDKKTYVVTYVNVAGKMMKLIKDRKKILVNKQIIGVAKQVLIVSLDEDTVFYFGNTKGSNKAQDCTSMVQVGWNAWADYIYSINYLCTDFTEDKINEFLQKCIDPETSERFTKYLSHKENYKFVNPSLYIYQNYCMVTDFIQEVFRTKLRNYNFKGNVEVNCFQADPVLIEIISQLFPGCKIETISQELDCFTEEKIVGRKNDVESVAQKIIKWWKAYEWNDTELKLKNILELTGISNRQLDKAKSKNKNLQEFLDKHKGSKRGYYTG